MSVRVDPDSLVDPGFVGIPYRHNGRSFDGTDCIGLVILWFEERGYRIGQDSDGRPIGEDWSDEDPQRYMRALMEYGEYVDFRQSQPGDVVLILNQDPDPDRDARFVASTGVVIDPGHFLVTTKEKGSRVATFSMHNLRYFVGAIRPSFDENKRIIRKPKVLPQQAEQSPAADA